MKTKFGHVTYCSNIHLGESWKEHWKELKTYLPKIKKQVSPDTPFALGLRLSNQASIELLQKENLKAWKNWMEQESLYIVSINGFPFGGFHTDVVKENVYLPDWSKEERLDYTIRLFSLLKEVLPAGEEGGVSTPPLSYSFFDSNDLEKKQRRQICTKNIIRILVHLIHVKIETNQTLHLDIEPEPDGVLGTFFDFIRWYEEELIPTALPILSETFGTSSEIGKQIILDHIRLCLDVCHLAVSFEMNPFLFSELNRTGIKVGRMQVSSALKVRFENQPNEILELLKPFDEKKYLHQVISSLPDGTKVSYRDLGFAIEHGSTPKEEWRIHFHVPIFLKSYGTFSSTQEELLFGLEEQKKSPFTNLLEIETYTWGVLPSSLQMPLEASITREIQWLQSVLGIFPGESGSVNEG